MSHDLYKDEVTEEYRVRFPNGTASVNSLKERNKIAAKLFQGESNEVQETIQREAEEELKAARARYEGARKGLPSDSYIPEDVEEYI
jgi:hypothetical protein